MEYHIALRSLKRKVIDQIPDKPTSTYIIRLKKEVCPAKIVAYPLGIPAAAKISVLDNGTSI